MYVFRLVAFISKEWRGLVAAWLYSIVGRYLTAALQDCSCPKSARDNWRGETDVVFGLIVRFEEDEGWWGLVPG